MKKTYRFLGTVSEIGGIATLNKLGQPVELTDEIYKMAVVGGCALIPDSDYSRIFRPSDAKDFGTPARREAAPADFQARYHAGIARFDEISAAFHAGANPFAAAKAEEVKNG